MSTAAQSAHYFAKELEEIGIVIPENTTSICINAPGFDKSVTILFESLSLSSPYTHKSGGVLKDKNGNEVSSTVLYNVIKKAAQLPDETTSFEITAKCNEIALVKIQAALPKDSLLGLKSLLR